ncbi:MAG: hypothetical protein AAGH70_05565 [Pseudomonadota bacterium]
MRFTSAALVAATALATGSLAPPLAAQESAESPGGMSLELNTIRPSDTGGCQLVIRGENGTDSSFADVSWVLAVFDGQGAFMSLLSLPLRDMPAGHRKVVQFSLDTACTEMSEIIVNDVGKCTLAEGGESGACLAAKASSRTDIAFGF